MEWTSSTPPHLVVERDGEVRALRPVGTAIWPGDRLLLRLGRRRWIHLLARGSRRAPPARYPAPFRNSGILTHNEKMFHRGEASGPRHMRSVPDLQLDSAIHGVGDSEWAICNGDEEIARYHDRHMRFLFHYGAFVFDDMAELRRYFEHTDDLDLDTAVAIFTDDLRGRGIRCPEPTDPLHDRDFVSVLNSAYAMAPAEYPAEAPLDVPNTA